jgi:hypothetical protein
MDEHALKNDIKIRQIGDPNVIKALQHFLMMAQTGEISGVAIVALSQNGSTHSQPVLPNNPVTLQLAMGALESLKLDLNDMLKQFKRQQSPILRARPM